jgi:hypothetical protein
MDAATRKMGVVRDDRHRRPTARSLPEVTHEVSSSQIVDARPANSRRRRASTLNDVVTQQFFAEGSRQEEAGVFTETAVVRIRSLDRVPRRRWPMMLAFFLLLAGAVAAAWWLGLRPPIEWQRSEIWQRLHLPNLPPPAHR